MQLVERGELASGEGDLVGGFTTSAALHPLVPRLLRAFHETHAAISFDLHESNAAELTEAVLTERLDFAIMRAPVARPPTLAFVDLGSESLVVALPSSRTSGPKIARRNWQDRDHSPKGSELHSWCAAMLHRGYMQISWRPAG